MYKGNSRTVFLFFSLTLKQQKPINGAEGVVIDLNLGSLFATKLGLSEIDEWDSKTATTLSESSMEDAPDLQNLQQSIDEGETGGGKKKNSNNKKSKKKKKK